MCSCGSRKEAAISGCGFGRRLRSDEMTKVAAVIRADNAAEAERQSRMALEKGADLVELRLDHVRDLGSSTIRKLAGGGRRPGLSKVAAPVTGFEGATQPVARVRSRNGRHRRFVLIGTGADGMVTRALAAPLGQEIQYAPWGLSAAPGQLSLGTATRLRGREPMILGLIGHPVEHSISSTMHEAALSALGFPAAYLPFDIPPEALDQFLLAAERLRIRGFNVTSPHKEAVARSVDELDGDAERLGVVNTVVLRDGWTAGHNTDVYGFRISLRSLGLRVGDRNALVVGAGGAAKAVVDVLLREGAHVQLTNRTASRAEALAKSFDDRIEVLALGILTRKGPWDLLVNATPAGTKGVPDGLPVPEAVIGKAGFIYDLVYNPPVTPLLRAAKRLNRPGASGLAMLVHQGAKAFELWTGQAAPFDAMERAAKEALR